VPYRRKKLTFAISSPDEFWYNEEKLKPVFVFIMYLCACVRVYACVCLCVFSLPYIGEIK